MIQKLYVLRHAETKMNLDGKIRGWSNPPLDKHGITMAKEIGQKLKKAPIDVIVSSDLKRAHLTARIVSKLIKKPIKEVSKEYRPWDVGKLTGKESEKVGKIMGQFITKYPDKKIDGGESFNAFKQRFLSAIDKLLKKYPKQNILLVTHHRGERLLDAWFKAGQKENMKIKESLMAQEGVPPAGIKVYTRNV